MTIQVPSDVARSTIFVHDSSGALVGETPAEDPSVALVVTVPPCGMVTVYTPDELQPDAGVAVTWTDVRTGDFLVHEDHLPATSTFPVRVEIPPLADATSYRVTLICSSIGGATWTTTSTVVTRDVSCPTASPTISAVVAAVTPAGPRLAIAAEVTLGPSSPTTISPGPFEPVPVPISLHRTSVRPVRGWVSIVRTLGEPDRSYVESQAMQTAYSSDETIALAMDPGAPRMLRMEVEPMATGAPRHRVVVRRKLSLDVDLDDDDLPTVDAQIAAGARPSVTWTSDRAIEADLATIRIRSTGVPAGIMAWTLIARTTPGTHRFPEVPPALLATPYRLDELRLDESSDLASYDDAKQRWRHFSRPPNDIDQWTLIVTLPP